MRTKVSKDMKTFIILVFIVLHSLKLYSQKTIKVKFRGEETKEYDFSIDTVSSESIFHYKNVAFFYIPGYISINEKKKAYSLNYLNGGVWNVKYSKKEETLGNDELYGNVPKITYYGLPDNEAVTKLVIAKINEDECAVYLYLGRNTVENNNDVFYSKLIVFETDRKCFK